METSPVISSFVIRIIQDPSPETVIPFRGNIRHVQSNQEIGFTDLAEAVEFINDFIPLNPVLQDDLPNLE